MSDDFLAREQAILGGSFSPSGIDSLGGSGETDVNRAASAFPDLDAFDSEAPLSSIPASHAPLSGLSDGLGDGFGDFENIPSFSQPPSTDVKVTGDADLDQFESQFPDLDTVCGCSYSSVLG